MTRRQFADSGLNLVTIIASLALFKPFLESFILSYGFPVSATLVQIALSGVALVWMISQKGLKSLLNLNTLPILAMLGWLAFSLTWSLDPVYGSWKLTGWVNNALLPALAVYALITRGGQRINWYWFLAFSAAVSLTILVFGTGDRTSIDNFNVIWVGRISLTAFTVALFARMPLIVRLPLLALFVAAAFSAESRGPVVSLVVVLGVYGLYQLGLTVLSGGRRMPLAAWAVSVFALLPLALGVNWVTANADVILESRFAQLGTDDDGTVSTRAELIGTATEAWQNSPLLGEGLGGFSSHVLNYYPHNLVAELASEGGLVALGLLAWLLMMGLRSAKGAGPLPLLLFLQTVGYALFSGSIAANAEYFVFFSILTASALAAPRMTRVLRAEDWPPDRELKPIN